MNGWMDGWKPALQWFWVGLELWVSLKSEESWGHSPLKYICTNMQNSTYSLVGISNLNQVKLYILSQDKKVWVFKKRERERKRRRRGRGKRRRRERKKASKKRRRSRRRGKGRGGRREGEKGTMNWYQEPKSLTYNLFCPKNPLYRHYYLQSPMRKIKFK